jgi:hypothetical protein
MHINATVWTVSKLLILMSAAFLKYVNSEIQEKNRNWKGIYQKGCIIFII